MARRSSTYRNVWTLAGGTAAIAMGVRAVLDWGSGTAVPLLLVAAAIVAAIVMRRTTFRD